MTAGKSLVANQRTLVAENGQDRDQQHPSLREASAAAHAVIGQRLEKTEQVGCGGWFCKEEGQDCRAVPTYGTVAAASGPGLLGQTYIRA